MRNVLTSPGEEGSGGAGQGGGIGDRLRKSFVAVLPNLEESYVAQSFERDQDLEDVSHLGPGSWAHVGSFVNED